MGQVRDEFGLRLSYLRKKAGLTQGELADRIGVARNTIGSIERGKLSPKFDNLEKLAKVLNIQIRQLFKFEDETL
ncbi:hypothetical protein MNBD_GAMMA11-2583 [hydrothermal vent metagenome]|uniref:HTH cro/C1-type domain-containing protein n=1 Tax=hydrothermal vent metagenome TaxID=652676 RepID=A0A3B0WWD7_9ZZZZ